MGEAVGRVKIMNTPDRMERYAVARASAGELWYWGSWADEDEAKNVAREIGGTVADMEGD